MPACCCNQAVSEQVFCWLYHVKASLVYDGSEVNYLSPGSCILKQTDSIKLSRPIPTHRKRNQTFFLHARCQKIQVTRSLPLMKPQIDTRYGEWIMSIFNANQSGDDLSGIPASHQSDAIL
ncbi:hypothetical protein AV903_09815 [Erwinia tracheiphila]|uniref:Uncharacterized protein n=1 Tax=Erwinia tracheiphila TaxID=65700 RepID=A0A345CS60_9GAMM|nr:hypothetical protein AV903_09815 [Erwinia tracheiphila]